MDRARAEIALCERILAKTGETVLTATLRGAERLEHWQHFPQGDVYDPESGAVWFYHCHPKSPTQPEEEHGHFHCFLRPEGKAGPIHHLIAIGMTATGRPLRLFTVNQWVVADDWLDATGTIALLSRFDVHLARPDYLVNRWLTAMVMAHEAVIADLIGARDAQLANLPAAAREDRALEVLSSLALPV
ncbi:MAG: hypothetical protein K9G72_20945 [Rhodobacteraceae bacterium]|nr:hypothetical protein [Paracoccaceae bacterium]